MNIQQIYICIVSTRENMHDVRRSRLCCKKAARGSGSKSLKLIIGGREHVIDSFNQTFMPGIQSSTNHKIIAEGGNSAFLILPPLRKT